MTSSRANRRGIFALMGAMAAFAVNDMILKLTAQRYPLGEVITVRGTIATLLVGSLLIGFGQFYALRAASNRFVLSRTVFDGLAMVLFTTALIHMPLAELSAINLVSPLIITAAAVFFFAEEVGWRRWTAIAVGFVGTLLIVKPTPGAFNAWALLGVATAFAGVARDMITRKLDAGIPSLLISFLAAAGSMIIGPILGLFETWQPMAAFDVGMLAISAAFVGERTFPGRDRVPRRCRRRGDCTVPLHAADLGRHVRIFRLRRGARPLRDLRLAADRLQRSLCAAPRGRAPPHGRSLGAPAEPGA